MRLAQLGSTKSIKIQWAYYSSQVFSAGWVVACNVAGVTTMTARRDTLFGLPRYVLAILRHMEVHSERLKWSLAEESNQLTLTLTWNFDSAKPRKTKVQQQYYCGCVTL